MSHPQLEKDISALESEVKDLVTNGTILAATDRLLSAKDALYTRAPTDRTWWNDRIRVLHTAFKLLKQFKTSERPADKTLVYFAKLSEQINILPQSDSSSVAQQNKPGASAQPLDAPAKVDTTMATKTTSKSKPTAPTAPAKSSGPTPTLPPAPPKPSVSKTVTPSVPPKAPALPQTTSATAAKTSSTAAPTKQGATATSRPSTSRPTGASPPASHLEADTPRDERPAKKDQPKSKKLQKGKAAAEQGTIGENDDDEYAPETVPKGKAKRRKGQPATTKVSAPTPADENDDDDSIVVNSKKPKKAKGKGKAKQDQAQEEATDDEKVTQREYVVSGTYNPPCRHCEEAGTTCAYPPHRGSCIPCKVSKKKCGFALTKEEMGNIFRMPKTKKPKQANAPPPSNVNYMEISDDESTSTIPAPPPAASTSARASAPDSVPFNTLVEPFFQRITSTLERLEQSMTPRVDNIDASLRGLGTRLERMERMLVHLDRNDAQLEHHGGAVDRLLYAFCEWQGMPGVGRNPRPGQLSAPSGAQPVQPNAQAGPSTSGPSGPPAEPPQMGQSQGQTARPLTQQQHQGPHHLSTTSPGTPAPAGAGLSTTTMPETHPPQSVSASSPLPPQEEASLASHSVDQIVSPSADNPALPSATGPPAAPLEAPGTASNSDEEMGAPSNTSIPTGPQDEGPATLSAPLPDPSVPPLPPASDDIPSVTLEPATPLTSQEGTSGQQELLAPPAPRRSPRIRSPTPMPSGGGKRKSSNASSSESKRQKL